ncbi:transglycosylase domain-containing protein [Luedemannella flava]
MSAEDRTFETNPGIDMKGIVRAAYNNFTGGTKQGASTITQQYARAAADLTDVTYSRKLQEAVMAWKMDDDYTKAQIMDMYLNTVYFGRNAYGIEAAAFAYFNKSAKSLTLAEAIVLAGVIKSPGDGAFDPSVNLQAAKDRFDYIRKGLYEKPLAKFPQADMDALSFPTKFVKWSTKTATVNNKLGEPTGLVVQHALSELRQSGDPDFKDRPKGYIENAGFKIITTVDKRANDIAIDIADEKDPDSYLYKQPSNLQAALVSVQPGTGRVLAYFGGHNGAGSDYAGWYYDEDGTPTGYGAHPPGSSFKAYALAAALKEGISVKSYWASPKSMEFPKSGRTKSNPVRNSSSAKCQPVCNLIDSTVASLNVPFFGLTEQLGADKVIDMARAAGIQDMWASIDDKSVRQDLRKKTGADVTPYPFQTEVGIGQYPVTVVDHANGMATFAADGIRAQVHFVKSVTDGGKPIYSEQLPTGKDKPILNQNAINDLDYTLSKVEAGRLSDGTDSASKTGTWQYGKSTVENAHAWTVGYTKQLATAIWVGNKSKEKPLRLKSGQLIYGSTLGGPMYREFQSRVAKALDLKRESSVSPSSWATTRPATRRRPRRSSTRRRGPAAASTRCATPTVRSPADR